LRSCTREHKVLLLFKETFTAVNVRVVALREATSKHAQHAKGKVRLFKI
jgi:hypothetical protein